MSILGWILIVLSTPLFLGALIAGKGKASTWLRLGLVMAAVGFLIVLLGSAIS